MICQICEEKKSTTHYGELYHFCDECNDWYLSEVAREYLADKGDVEVKNESWQLHRD